MGANPGPDQDGRGCPAGPDQVRRGRRGVLTTGGANGTVTLWDWGQNIQLGVIRTGDADVTAMTFDPQNKSILATAGSEHVRVWDSANGLPVHSLTGVTGPVTSLEYASNGQLLGAGGARGQVALLPIEDW